MPCRNHVPSVLQAACNAADVIVLLFATDRSDALARIGSHWLPELRRIGVRAPVILVGTKSDLKSADHNLQQVSCMQVTGAQLQLQSL
jgi:mitochondrial Rho GTPase 1